MARLIKTRFLILSDTHGDELRKTPNLTADVAIHCGDLTEESKIDEFRSAIKLLRSLDSPIKLVIASNHDFTLDTPNFEKRLASANLDEALVKKEYGAVGEARALLHAEAETSGIVFLDEGTHQIALANGALLTVYASPYTPSLSNVGFQYRPEDVHTFAIGTVVDVVVTHGPPKGIFDMTYDRKRAGSDDLFAAVAKARPRLHCFGHIHEGWGAKLVAWREATSATPSHFTDIEHGSSVAIESLATVRPGKFDSEAMAREKKDKWAGYQAQGFCATSHCAGDLNPLVSGQHTLFVNAAIEGENDESQQLSWLVEIDLPATRK